MFISFMVILKKLGGLYNINKIWTLTRKVNKIWTLTRKFNIITLKLNPNMSGPCEGCILIIQSYLRRIFFLHKVAYNNDLVFNEHQKSCNFLNLSWS